MAMICSPACTYWIYLYYKSKDDFEAVCDCPDRREPNGKKFGLPVGQVCRLGKHINDHLEE